MYSLKKTILNILIGIAAVGVATADDTSSDASSVSLSLSSANVVPSNKAGKQPKAGKQVKAAVGKAVKAKAIKYDNSMSNSMSMSYGHEVDPDSEKAGLVFIVRDAHRALRNLQKKGKFPTIPTSIRGKVYLTAAMQVAAAQIVGLAADDAAAEQTSLIKPRHITSAVTRHSGFRQLLSDRSSDPSSDAYTVCYTTLKHWAPKGFALTKNSMSAINDFIDGIFVRIAFQAGSFAETESAVKVTQDHFSRAILVLLTKLGAPPGEENTINELRYSIIDRAERAVFDWGQVN